MNFGWPVPFNTRHYVGGGSSPQLFPIAGNGLTVTASTPLIDLTQTWNNVAVTFIASRIVVTDTTSAAASLLADWRVGATSMFSVDKTGVVLANTRFDVNPASNSGGQLRANGLRLGADSSITFTSGLSGGSGDLILARDAANALAQRTGANAQTFRWYGNYVSATDYHRGAVSSAKQTLSNVSGASVTATGLIPDGATCIGVTTKVTTGLGTGGGTTGYAVGTGADPNRWGDIVGTIAGTTSDTRDNTSGLIDTSIGATDVVLTAAGGNFNGTGVIDVCAFYLIAQAD